MSFLFVFTTTRSHTLQFFCLSVHDSCHFQFQSLGDCTHREVWTVERLPLFRSALLVPLSFACAYLLHEFQWCSCCDYCCSLFLYLHWTSFMICCQLQFVQACLLRCLCFACDYGSYDHCVVFVNCMLYVDVFVFLWRFFFRTLIKVRMRHPIEWQVLGWISFCFKLKRDAF